MKPALICGSYWLTSVTEFGGDTLKPLSEKHGCRLRFFVKDKVQPSPFDFVGT